MSDAKAGAKSPAPNRCPLCGGDNRCALALPEAERPAQCWCVSRRFPAELVARAPAGACICAECLDRETEASD